MRSFASRIRRGRPAGMLLGIATAVAAVAVTWGLLAARSSDAPRSGVGRTLDAGLPATPSDTGTGGAELVGSARRNAARALPPPAETVDARRESQHSKELAAWILSLADFPRIETRLHEYNELVRRAREFLERAGAAPQSDFTLIQDTLRRSLHALVGEASSIEDEDVRVSVLDDLEMTLCAFAEAVDASQHGRLLGVPTLTTGEAAVLFRVGADEVIRGASTNPLLARMVVERRWQQFDSCLRRVDESSLDQILLDGAIFRALEDGHILSHSIDISLLPYLTTTRRLGWPAISPILERCIGIGRGDVVTALIKVATPRPPDDYLRRLARSPGIPDEVRLSIEALVAGH